MYAFLVQKHFLAGKWKVLWKSLLIHDDMYGSYKIAIMSYTGEIVRHVACDRGKAANHVVITFTTDEFRPNDLTLHVSQ